MGKGVEEARVRRRRDERGAGRGGRVWEGSRPGGGGVGSVGDLLKGTEIRTEKGWQKDDMRFRMEWVAVENETGEEMD